MTSRGLCYNLPMGRNLGNGKTTRLLKYWQQTRNPNECWEWPYAREKTGYGVATHDSKKIGAHRLSLLLAGHDIRGLLACHTCDNPPCVNPNHLFLGSYLDNEHDKISKGRKPNKEKHPMVKLTIAQVEEIRAKSSQGESQRSLAKQYGVCKTNIAQIIHRRTWT